ncbi:DUF4062 domain-containing protein [Rathayibacter caricis]|uniref:DUF4062 domain-containing protein n=1 Tax=Rathayibacter caricis TaxID=110936 RepID=UPI001FB29A22|nr:DUF4062 domain-containing protein [Rathayibacter caricis]MCJ1698004.1 DUF4062 domain-containing protein [Rathayibacter caricis]
MRIFISSVRAGLEEEREALPGLIQALGHVPVRFEDFTAQPVPSREACLQAVAASDAYLLLLGPNYGTPFPDTGQSPTHDEWIAASNNGLPRFVFRKNGAVSDEKQQAFEASLGDYRSGRFWKTFNSTADLQTAVAAVIRKLDVGSETLTFEPLSRPVEISWFDLGQNSQTYSAVRPQLEVHLAPLDAQPLSERVLDQIEAALPSHVRASSLVDHSSALNVRHLPGQVDLLAPEPERRQWGNDSYQGHLAGVTAITSGQVSVRFGLPGDSMGTIYDPQDITARIAAALRLIGQIGVVKAPYVAIGVGLTSTTMVTVGTAGTAGRTSGSMPRDRGPIHVEPDEAISKAALDQGAGEVAVTLNRALLRTIQNV